VEINLEKQQLLIKLILALLKVVLKRGTKIKIDFILFFLIDLLINDLNSIIYFL
jgi:hypothetical protein